MKKKKKNKIELLKIKYRVLEHNICYKENYSKRVIITLLILLILDLIVLYLVWWLYGRNGF